MSVIVIVTLLLAGTAFLALSETSLVASKRSRLQEWESHGRIGARVALQLKSQPDFMMTTIQVGVTIISIALGAYSDSIIAPFVESLLKQSRIPDYIAHLFRVLVISAIIYLSLLAELGPKRLALQNPEVFAEAISRPMAFLLTFLHPLVVLVNSSTTAFLRMFPHPRNTNPPVTENEILRLVQQATSAGVFGEFERQMLESIVRLESIKLSSLMTPRTDMLWLNVTDDLQTVLDKLANWDQWEVPVCQETADDVLGVVSVRDILRSEAEKRELDLRQMLQPALFVPDTEDALFMLRAFKSNTHHIAILLDEFGGVTGTVTIRAVVEEIVGDIHSTGGQHIRQVEGPTESWEVDGMTPVMEFADAFGRRGELPDVPDYATVAGLVIDELGHVPHAGEEIDWNGLNIKVVSLDGHRIDRLRVTKAA